MLAFVVPGCSPICAHPRVPGHPFAGLLLFCPNWLSRVRVLSYADGHRATAQQHSALARLQEVVREAGGGLDAASVSADGMDARVTELCQEDGRLLVPALEQAQAQGMQALADVEGKLQVRSSARFGWSFTERGAERSVRTPEMRLLAL